MSFTDKKSKIGYFVETGFLYVVSWAVMYCTLILSVKVNFFELSHNKFYLWRLNPYLALPYLVAILLGMVAIPLGWETIIRKISCKEIGLTSPDYFLKESIYGAVFFILFLGYRYVFFLKEIIISALSMRNVIYLSAAWLFVAFGEELLYRGVMQRRLTVLFGKYWGLVLASILFAFLGHPKTPFIDNLILRLPFGLILGYLYLRGNSLIVPIGLHGGINVMFTV